MELATLVETVKKRILDYRSIEHTLASRRVMRMSSSELDAIKEAVVTGNRNLLHSLLQCATGDLNELRVVDLKIMARRKNIPYYSRMTKSELIHYLEKAK